MLDDEIFILLEVQSTGSTKHQPSKRKLPQIIQTALSKLASATVNYSMPTQVPVSGNPFGILHQFGLLAKGGRYMDNIHNIWTYINESSSDQFFNVFAETFPETRKTQSLTTQID